LSAHGAAREQHHRTIGARSGLPLGIFLAALVTTSLADAHPNS
jgi:hypothetical protein